MSDKLYTSYGEDKLLDLENENVTDALKDAVGGGGGAPFIVTFIRSGDSYTCDKTFVEVKEAYANSVVLFNINNINAVVTGIDIDGINESYQASAMTTMEIDGTSYLMSASMTMYSNGTITPTLKAYTLEPAE